LEQQNARNEEEGKIDDFILEFASVRSQLINLRQVCNQSFRHLLLLDEVLFLFEAPDQRVARLGLVSGNRILFPNFFICIIVVVSCLQGVLQELVRSNKAEKTQPSACAH
jgi:hypothetical protein